MWCWRWVEKTSWTDHARNEEVLLRVNEQRNILHEIRKRKANWIGHILRRNCLLQWVIEGKIKGGIEVTGRRGRRCRKLLDDLKDRRGYSHLKEEALDRTMLDSWLWMRLRTCRKATKWMNDCTVTLFQHIFENNFHINVKVKVKVKVKFSLQQATKAWGGGRFITLLL